MHPSRLVRAKEALAKSGLMDTLASYSPTVVSTIWVELDTDASDIDIICCYSDAHEFFVAVENYLKAFSQSTIHRNGDRVLANFQFEGFPIEIYGSKQAISQQNAYRHFKQMQRLVSLNKTELPQRIRALKVKGLKTEPAIARLLQLEGDPYAAVLELEKCNDQQLSELVKAKLTI